MVLPYSKACCYSPWRSLIYVRLMRTGSKFLWFIKILFHFSGFGLKNFYLNVAKALKIENVFYSLLPSIYISLLYFPNPQTPYPFIPLVLKARKSKEFKGRPLFLQGCGKHGLLLLLAICYSLKVSFSPMNSLWLISKYLF